MSRRYVCVRLDSYENMEHMDKVRDLLDGRLANTAFAIYAPDAKTKLTPQSRGPHRIFGRNAPEQGLKELADKYPGRKLDEPAHTPDFTSLREAINIASCDERPLIIAWCKDEMDRAAIEEQLRPLAWHKEFIGRAHWDLSLGEDFRAFVSGAPEGERGVVVVQPEPYGRTGTVIATIDLEQTLDEQRSTLWKAFEDFEASFSKLPYEQHVQQGLRKGIVWEEAVKMGERDDGGNNDRARRDGGRDRERGRRDGDRRRQRRE